NSDTEPLADSFTRLLDWMKTHPQTGIAGPELIGPQNEFLQMSWSLNPLLAGEVVNRYFAPQNIDRSAFRRRLIRRLQNKPRAVPFICGACLMIRRDVFDRLKGFDETYELYFEDADLCRRCTKAGWQVDFIPHSKIIHRIGQSTKGIWNMSVL